MTSYENTFFSLCCDLQDGVHAMDCWNNAKPISSSSDRTVRQWKIAEESHLVFRGHKSNIDNVQVLNDTHFVSSGQDGNIHLWKDSIKSPIAGIQAAHGLEGSSTNPRWISSLSSVKMSNLVASGSNDGGIRLWDVNCENKSITHIRSLDAVGFVNAMTLTPNVLIAATGAEHRLGRWWHMKGNRNRIVIFRFNSENSADL
jgi:ribosomal RNA-processing protein 9